MRGVIFNDAVIGVKVSLVFPEYPILDSTGIPKVVHYRLTKLYICHLLLKMHLSWLLVD